MTFESFRKIYNKFFIYIKLILKLSAVNGMKYFKEIVFKWYNTSHLYLIFDLFDDLMNKHKNVVKLNTQC